MRINVEKRLHRVKISLDRSKSKCPCAQFCERTSNCDRCNLFYEKCTIYNKDKSI